MCEICDARAAKIREASQLMLKEDRIVEAMWFMFRLYEPPGASEADIEGVREIYFACAHDLMECLENVAAVGGRKAVAETLAKIGRELDTEMLRNQTAMGHA
jgi:hypothetical protein